MSQAASYLRAYPHRLTALNAGKARQLNALFKPYQSLASQLLSRQIQQFEQTGRFNKMAPISTTSLLSARYQQTCQYQVVAMLNSWVVLRVDDFKQFVLRSSLSGNLRQELMIINRRKDWYGNPDHYTPGTLRLAQHIFRHLRHRHRWPSMKHINLSLDAKVATIEKSKTGTFSHWIKLSTMTAGKPIWIPLQANPRFDKAGGQRKNFVQFNRSREGQLSASLIKEHEPLAYQPRTPVLALDTGLCFLFATDQGDLLGTSLFQQLKDLDARVTQCAEGRQRRGLRVRCARYDGLVARVRGLLRCEIGRVLNRLVDRLAPAEIVMEALDFRHAKLSRRLNRILRNFGRGVVKDKLAALHETLGIVVTEVPAAYTSQACPNCHCVDKKNRRARDVFRCVHCGYQRHADVVGACNIKSRRSWFEAKAGYGLLMRREAVLSRCRDAHRHWRAQRIAVRCKRGLNSGPPSPARTIGHGEQVLSGEIRQLP